MYGDARCGESRANEKPDTRYGKAPEAATISQTQQSRETALQSRAMLQLRAAPFASFRSTHEHTTARQDTKSAILLLEHPQTNIPPIEIAPRKCVLIESIQASSMRTANQKLPQSIRLKFRGHRKIERCVVILRGIVRR